MIIIEKLKSIMLNLIKSRFARLRFSLFFGAAINLFYLLTNLVGAILYKSVWSATVTGYHLLFVVIRSYLLFSKRFGKDRRLCGIVLMRVGSFLLLIDLLTLILMIFSLIFGNSTSYSGNILLCILLFTLYSLFVSLLGMKRGINDNNPLHFAAKNLSLSSALMSVFNLQFSIFSFMGIDAEVTIRLITLGGVLSFLIIAYLSCRLIVKGRRLSQG